MLLKDVLSKSIQFFKDKKFDSPRLEAELLLRPQHHCQEADAKVAQGGYFGRVDWWRRRFGGAYAKGEVIEYHIARSRRSDDFHLLDSCRPGVSEEDRRR